MFRSESVNKILFEWDTLEVDEIRRYCNKMHVKLLRWLGANHPDNRTRKIFFDMTNVTIGEDTVINQNFIVSDNYLPLLKIGKRVAISPNVTIICASAPNNSLLSSIPYVNQNLICEKEVIIEDDVWIGTNVVVLPGITIGRGAIIGAGSIVTRNVECDTIYAGLPAKKIRDLK